MPHWNQQRLKEHFAKHPGGQCAHCWSCALNQRVVTIADYESASQSVVADNWLAFSAQCKTDGGPLFNDYCYYVDFRLLVTIVKEEADRITTCYRFHRLAGYHEDLQVDLAARLDVLDRFISWKDNSTKMLRNIKKRNFSPKTKADNAAYAKLNIRLLQLLKIDEFEMRPRTRF